MKCEIDDCINETVDEYRKCVICGKHMCWSHVVRVEVTAHADNGVTYSEPMYLCAEHTKEILSGALYKKYKIVPSASLSGLLCRVFGISVSVMEKRR